MEKKVYVYRMAKKLKKIFKSISFCLNELCAAVLTSIALLYDDDPWVLNIYLVSANMKNLRMYEKIVHALGRQKYIFYIYESHKTDQNG